MRAYSRLGLAAVAAVLLGLAAAAQAKAIAIAVPQTPAARVANADVVVVGKVTDVEAEPVAVSAYPGAKDEKVLFKVAVLKIDEALLGGAGVTRIRVGFPADAAAPPPPVGGPQPVGRPVGGRIRPPAMVVALEKGMEGVFFLTRHHDGDFYVTAGGPPLLAREKTYAKDLEQVKKATKTIDDPVAALKAKDVEDRFQAAQMVLQRYQSVRGGVRAGRAPAREPIPPEENKLIVALLQELPWMPDASKPRTPADPVPPSRSALWYMINPQESGFKQPMFPPRKPGDPPVDFNKIMDESTSNFLKENAEKITIKRFVVK